jgi:hypothetical protein
VEVRGVGWVDRGPRARLRGRLRVGGGIALNQHEGRHGQGGSGVRAGRETGCGVEKRGDGEQDSGRRVSG